MDDTIMYILIMQSVDTLVHIYSCVATIIFCSQKVVSLTLTLCHMYQYQIAPYSYKLKEKEK